MKILFSNYACNPNQGGESSNGWNWPNSIAKLGHDVTIITYVKDRDQVMKQLSEQFSHNIDVHFVDIPFWSKPFLTGKIQSYFRYFIWQWLASSYAVRLHNEQKFDLVHHASLGTLIGGSFMWRLKIPFVFGPVGGMQIAPQKLKKYFGGYWWKESIRTFFTKNLAPINPFLNLTVRKVDLFLAMNQDTFDFLNQSGARKVVKYMGPGLPENYFIDDPVIAPEVNIESDIVRLLWVGRILPRKALLLALEALSHVDTQTLWKLEIVGGGDLNSKVLEWVKDYNLDDRVDYLGQVSWLALKKCYKQSDIFLFTSLRDSFGAQVLEALAHAVPLITLDHQGVGTFLTNGAAVKIDINKQSSQNIVNSLSSEITRLIEDPTGRRRIGLKGFEFAKQQAWLRKAKKVEEYYQDLLNLNI